MLRTLFTGSLESKSTITQCISTKTPQHRGVFCINLTGGPTYTFLEHLSTEKLTEDLILLHARLADLGVEYHYERVQLKDLAE
jgi:hypothetical protein